MIAAQYRKIFTQLSARHGRKKSPFFIVEGSRCCREAISRRPEWLEAAFCTEEFLRDEKNRDFASLFAEKNIFCETIPAKELSEYCDTENSPGILLLMRRPPRLVPDSLPRGFCLILDQVREPGNMGTILRTAWAVGLDAVWLTAGCADVFASKVVRAGMGAQFALKLEFLPPLEEAVGIFRQLGGSRVWCTMPGQGVSLYSEEFHLEHSALVIGNEANGISVPEVGQAVTIPMPGCAESLNAAQAATVFLFEGVRRKIL